VPFDFLLSNFHQYPTSLCHKRQAQQAVLLCDTLPRRTTRTSGGRVVENITVFQLSYQAPALHGTRNFNSLFTKSRHLFLSIARYVRYNPCHSICSLLSILKLSSHQQPSLPNTFSFSLQKPCAYFSSYLAHFFLLDLVTLKVFVEEYKSRSFGLRFFSPVSHYFLPHN
jgi:hypothetical protein